MTATNLSSYLSPAGIAIGPVFVYMQSGTLGIMCGIAATVVAVAHLGFELPTQLASDNGDAVVSTSWIAFYW